MKSYRNQIYLVIALLVLLSLFVGCVAIQPQRLGAASFNLTSVTESGSTAINDTLLRQSLAQIATGPISSAEADALLFMREEEKLAHDVYVTLGTMWGLPIFNNISQSEATHTSAIKMLLDRYQLSDPAATTSVGEFVNPTLQELYNQLVEQGSQSLADALRVGATIEDLDIVDLQTRNAQTERADIQLVYQNLMRGSRNHLRSFVSTLGRQTGESYQPQYLDQATFDSILSTAVERGQGRGRGR